MQNRDIALGPEKQYTREMPSPAQFKNYLEISPTEPFPGGGRVEILINENDCGKRVRAELVELQPEEGFPVHVHPKSDHVILVVQGTGELLWGDERRRITCGDTFVVPMGDVHSITAGVAEPLRFVVINVPPIDFHHHDFMRPVEPHEHAIEHGHKR
jgi:quercetin dioxygenase-like cupin family protein